MRLSELSVKRPVFATVISLMLVILGLMAATRLSIRELPDVESPVISIETDYLGASADVVETKITQVIEDRVAGLEGIVTITSQSVDGRSSIDLEFDPKRDVDAAANDVRDRVARVASDLPDEADPPEIGKADFNADPVIWLNLSSDKMNVLQLTDFAERNLVDRLGRAAGCRPRPAARRAALRDASVDRPRGARGATADRRRHRERAEARERPASGRAARVVAARNDLAHRDRPQHRAGLPAAGDRPRSGRIPGAPRRGRGRAARRGKRAQPVAVERRRRHQRRCRADLQGQHARGGAARPRRSRAHPSGPAGRHATRRQSRPLGVHRGVDEGGGHRAGDLAHAGAVRHLPVSRQPARDADPGRHDPDLHRLGVHGDGAVRLFDQHADAARAGARDRPRGRRRDRRAREHLPAHGERRTAADRRRGRRS